MNIDMHFHSTHSDGYNTHEEILSQAKQTKLHFITLTDHDVVSSSFHQLALDYGIPSCDAVEISANNSEHDKNLHILLYAPTISQKITKALGEVTKRKCEIIQKQVEKLNHHGFEINLAGVYQYFQSQGRKSESLNKFDISRYLYLSSQNQKLITEINQGKHIPLEDFYKSFLKKGGNYFHLYGINTTPHESSLEDCYLYKKECNGILSLAHPNFTFQKGGIQEFEKTLPHYIEHGVNAIEINSKATKDWIEAILSAKKRYGFYLTFGSDNHKIGKSDNKHGNFGEINPLIQAREKEKFFLEYSEILGYPNK